MSTIHRYTTALWPDRMYVLGRRMADYTLGHELLLQRIASPFVTEAAPPEGGDLRAAMLLCSRSYRAAAWLVNHPRWFALRLKFGFWPVIFRVALPPWRVPAGVLQFQRYLQLSMHHPRKWTTADASKPLGSPVCQQLKLMLMVHLGKTERQALATPFAAALWDAMAIWEMDGAQELVSDELMESMETLKDRAAGVPPAESGDA
jgi:hypothetical protein